LGVAKVNAQPTRLVLDTNIVLDCFVFHDPAARELTAAMEARRVQPLVHDVTLDELQRVLAYPQCRLDNSERQQVLDRYVASATLVQMPEGFAREALLLPTGFPRCRDPDDEPFLALALHARAEGLITKDRDILKLRRKARRFSVIVLAPQEVSFTR